jgi:cyclase
MLKRIIPILLVENKELIKTVKFISPTYIGDLLNSVKIYNELQVDELCILDKSAKINGIDYDLIRQFVDECFIPIGYGGGITKLDQISKILKLGVEKVVINTQLTNFKFIEAAVSTYGSSTIVACVDYKQIGANRIAFSNNGTKNEEISAEELIDKMTSIGVGEIVIQSIDLDGTYKGYDQEFVKKIVSRVNNPIVVAGGCKDISDIRRALENGASGAAAGSLFVYYTNAKGILINYPDTIEFEKAAIKR